MYRGGTNIDDVCAVIGYAATRKLVAWYAGMRLYVPLRDRPDHPLRVLLGLPAYNALVREWSGQHLRLPTVDEDRRLARDREIAGLLHQGVADAEIAERFSVTAERVGQIRRALTSNGLLDADLEIF